MAKPQASGYRSLSVYSCTYYFSITLSSAGIAYYLKNSISGGRADTVTSYGRVSDRVLVGDWNGDRRDTLAVRR